MLRVDGVSDVNIFGQRDYSIRVWLDPQKMASYGINAGDVADAIRRENLDLPAGRIGQPPIARGQPFDVPIDTLGRLATPEQFAEIIVKVDQGIPAPAATAAAAPAPVCSGLPAPGLANPLQGNSVMTGVASVPSGASQSGCQHRHAADGHDDQQPAGSGTAAADRPAAAQRPAAAAPPAAPPTPAAGR